MHVLDMLYCSLDLTKNLIPCLAPDAGWSAVLISRIQFLISGRVERKLGGAEQKFFGQPRGMRGLRREE